MENKYIMITNSGSAYKVIFTPSSRGKICKLDGNVAPLFTIESLNGVDVTTFKKVQDFLGKSICFSIGKDNGKITTEVIEIYQKIS